jgi:hypothetical protein
MVGMTDNLRGLNPSTIPLSRLELSVRTTNCLYNAGLHTIGDIMAKSDSELIAIPNFGRRCLREVKEILGVFDLALRAGPILSLEQQMQSALARARAAKHKYDDAMADIQRVAKLMAEKSSTGAHK